MVLFRAGWLSWDGMTVADETEHRGFKIETAFQSSTPPIILQSWTYLVVLLLYKEDMSTWWQTGLWSDFGQAWNPPFANTSAAATQQDM